MSRRLQPPGGDSDAAGRDGTRKGSGADFIRKKKASNKKEEAHKSCFIITAGSKPGCLFKNGGTGQSEGESWEM